MRVYAQKCGKIEIEIEAERNRAFGPDVVWLDAVRTCGTGGGIRLESVGAGP